MLFEVEHLYKLTKNVNISKKSETWDEIKNYKISVQKLHFQLCNY